MIRKIRTLHRQLGIILSLFIILLCITGVMLNHTHELKLTKKQINQPWLLSLYGIKPPAITSFKAANNIVSFNGKSVFFNQSPLESCDQLIGTTNTDNFLIIACEKKLLLLLSSGELIETIDEFTGLPTPITQIATSAGTAYITTNKNSFKVDTDNLVFKPEALPKEIITAAKITTPEAIKAAINNSDDTYGLNAERFIQDLHSGRILGMPGVIINDIIAALLLLMTITGLWIWLKRRR